MSKQKLNMNEKVLAKQIFLKIDHDKNFTFAIMQNVDGNVQLVTLDGNVVEKQERLNYAPLIEHFSANSINKNPVEILFAEEDKTSFHKALARNSVYDNWFNINHELSRKMSPWTNQKLVNFTSTLFMDCNPDKKIKIEHLHKLEKKITAHEKLLKFEQENLNRNANGADFVREYLQNLPKVSDPAAAPNLPLQSEISHDDNEM
jgi:hypothetical protein